jgi:endoglucanase
MNYANDMSPIRDFPIELDVPNKLVYSFHLYSWQSVTSYDSYDQYRAGLDASVGYILEEGKPYTAPLWLGEFGQIWGDNYWNFTMQWLSENERVGWSQWAWNGYKTTPD